jgi:tetratricopeptide (TPR) repeat protein
MKSIIFSTLVLLFGSSAFGQAGKLKRADANFQTLCYAVAATQYQGLIGSEVDSPQLKSKLAFCYFQMGDMANAISVYAQIVTDPTVAAEDLFHYALALKETGNYAGSDKWMRAFAAKVPNDLRAKSFLAQENYFQTIQERGSYFSIEKLTINSPFSDFGGYSTPDGKTTYFVSSRTDHAFVSTIYNWNNGRFLDLYKAERDSLNKLAHPVIISRNVNTKYHEGPLCFSADGKKVYFTRNNIAGTKRDAKGIQNLKLYTANVVNGAWVNEKEFPLNSADYSIGHPTLSADGKTLYFSSDMPGGFGGADLYKVVLNADGSVGKPENLGNLINTEGQELFPWFGQDGLLFFASNGHIGLGGLDVFVVLQATNGKKSTVINVGMPVNSAQDDFAFSMAPSQLNGYFSSNRIGSVGDDDIYGFQLLKPFVMHVNVVGVALDQVTNRPIPGAKITLMDQSGNVVATVISDQNGAYSIPVDAQGTFSLTAAKELSLIHI